MNQIFAVEHPLAVGQRVYAKRPTCACKAAKLEPVEGTIGKVIKNHSGYWYYLTERGITVKGDWVDNVF